MKIINSTTEMLMKTHTYLILDGWTIITYLNTIFKLILGQMVHQDSIKIIDGQHFLLLLLRG